MVEAITIIVMPFLVISVAAITARRGIGWLFDLVGRGL